MGKDSLPPWAGPVVLGAAGLVCLGAGVVLLLLQLSFGRRAARSQGTVIDCVMPSGTKSSAGMRVPVVEFMAAGRTVTFTAQIPSRDWPGRIGERLPVLYDPAHPERATVDDPIVRFAASAGWLIFGAAVAAAGVILRMRQFRG